jgi:hypothetical protein
MKKSNLRDILIRSSVLKKTIIRNANFLYIDIKQSYVSIISSSVLHETIPSWIIRCISSAGGLFVFEKSAKKVSKHLAN